jgi:hypothetical protein
MAAAVALMAILAAALVRADEGDPSCDYTTLCDPPCEYGYPCDTGDPGWSLGFNTCLR